MKIPISTPMLFLQRVLIGGGILIAVSGIAADWAGFGTEGFGFGPAQTAVGLVGLSITALGIGLRLERRLFKFLYTVILATGLFFLWCFWLYPASGYRVNFSHPVSLTFRVLIFSHLLIFVVSLCLAGIATRTVWKMNMRKNRHQKKGHLFQRFWDIQYIKTGIIKCILIFLGVWVPIYIVALGIGELYVRYTRGYLLWNWSLQKSNFTESEKRRIYNKCFYEKNQDLFRGWRVPIETFEADKPTPRYLFKPNLSLTIRGNKLVPSNPGEKVAWSSNSWGFRGSESPIEKRDQVIRIVCLGASTTEGSQGDLETYPYFLQQQLNQLFPTRLIEVINAGHSGQGSSDLLEILKQRVLPLRPDIVIYYQASNSIWKYDFLKKYENSPVEFTYEDCRFYNSSLFYRWLYTHSAIFVLLSDRFGWDKGKALDIPHEFDDTSPKPSVIPHIQNLRKIVRETLNHDSIIVLSSFITIAHEKLELSYEDYPAIFHDLYTVHCPFTPGELGRIFQYVNRQVKEVALEFEVPYADVAAEFPKDPQYFFSDIIHFSPEGNKKLANLFVQFLVKEVFPKLQDRQMLSGNIDGMRG